MKPDDRIPIYKMLNEYKSNNPLVFHMPGHIIGRGLCDELKLAGSLDITEIPGSDCLHAPHGAIKKAQDMAAGCFGADYSLFLVNGSTSGIQAMIQAAIEPGGKLILGRDSHISALNTLAQINGKPVFVMPQIEHGTNIPLGITADELRETVKANPDAQGILITRPNYYGIAAPLDKIVAIAKAYNIPLLIDEAHGAHFRFHQDFPKSAMELGADLCVQSLHKTLPALTQTAILHGRDNGLINKSRIETTASMVQTTSPSYVLMCSIDIARYVMESSGNGLYENLKSSITFFNKRLLEFTCIKRIHQNINNCDTDFTRIVLSFENTSLSGFKSEEILRTRYGIVAEMADFKNVVLIATPFHTAEDFDKLILALKEISEDYGVFSTDGKDCGTHIPLETTFPKWPDHIPQRIISLRRALFMKGQEIPIHKVEGRISGSYITPYPPGIPLLSPGERINADIVEYISALLRENCPVHGIENNKIKIIDIDSEC